MQKGLFVCMFPFAYIQAIWLFIRSVALTII